MFIFKKITFLIGFYLAIFNLQAKEISPEEFSSLKAEQNINDIRFNKKYLGVEFKGVGKISTIEKSTNAKFPGYFIRFYADKVSIFCITNDKKNIDFIADKNKNDLVKIQAFFDDSLSNKGFAFSNCKFSN